MPTPLPQKHKIKRPTPKWWGLAAMGTFSLLGYETLVRPRLRMWGATSAEAAAPMMGDKFIAHPALDTTHAITIQAPVEQVWPWIVQMGYKRAGFYTYRWLENLIPPDQRPAGRILNEHQNLQVGEVVLFSEDDGLPVVKVEAPHLLVLAGELHPIDGPASVPVSWSLKLEEAGPETTRLITRTRVAPFHPAGLSRLVYHFSLEPGHSIMERKLLLEIRDRAEDAAGRPRRTKLQDPAMWRRMKALNRRMAQNYRRGFGPHGLVLLLTTTGRKTGLARTTPLQYEEMDGGYTVASARGQAADWFRNAQQNPYVQVQIGDRQFDALAEPVTDPARLADFLEFRLRRRPFMLRLMLLAEGLPICFTRADLERFAANKAMLILYPNV